MIWKQMNLLRMKDEMLLVKVLQLLGRLCAERSFTSETLVNYRTQGPQIRFRVICQRHNNFRSHVHWRTTECSSHDSILQKSCKSKISYNDNKTKSYENLFPQQYHMYLFYNGENAIHKPIFKRISWGEGLGLLYVSKIFCGLRSLWTTPLECNARMAPANCRRNNLIVSSLSVPFPVHIKHSKQLDFVIFLREGELIELINCKKKYEETVKCQQLLPLK